MKIARAGDNPEVDRTYREMESAIIAHFEAIGKATGEDVGLLLLAVAHGTAGGQLLRNVLAAYLEIKRESQSNAVGNTRHS